MTKYLMTLRPMDTFFFGQENKYRKRDKKFEADYYQVSAYFPQQTTLLGMLRYYLLLDAGQIPITNDTEAALLIGKQSFCVSDEVLTFGAIKNISPVFITKGSKKYIPQPLDVILKEKKIKNLVYDAIDIKTNLPGEDTKFLFIKDYKEKAGLNNFLVNIQDQEDFFPYRFEPENAGSRGIFVVEERTGITKGKDGQTEEHAFYKQVVYKLKDDCAFACIVKLDDGYIKDGQSGFVPMGAEKSLFKISFQKTDESLEDLVDFGNFNDPKLVLLSDSYIPFGENLSYRFSVSQTKPFRFLHSRTEADRKYDKFVFEEVGRNEGVKRSERFNLFKRGSVFYFDKVEQINNMGRILKDQKNFYKIGYNHFISIGG